MFSEPRMMNIYNFIKLIILIIIFTPFVSKGEIKLGEFGPEFTATDHDGKTIDLDNLKGKWVVLYFYPKDDTPGCTIEAKQFTELYGEFLKKGAVVYGVSTDTKESHCDFIDKYKLKVPLIPDEEHKIMSLYDVKVSNGFASRDTIIIDPSGYVVKIYRNVKPAGHAREVMEFINENSTL